MERYYEYYPGLIEANYFDKLLPHFEKACKRGTITMYGKTFPSRRKSCMYSISDDAESGYSDIPLYHWDQAPKDLLELKDKITSYFGHRVDYVLVHIYEDHTDYIGLHNDSEALNSEIISVSLGAIRRFQFYPIDDRHTCVDEFYLKGGDVVHMFGPRGEKVSCQRKFKHQVPKMRLKELVEHLTERGIAIPAGRKTFQKLETVMKETDSFPLRINLTFRQFDVE
jgi:alkylated DNA repair dioxygenase AlkB